MVVVLVLAAALIEVRMRLERISAGLARCGRAGGRRGEHLRPLEGAVTAINAQFEIILGALPGIAPQGRGRRREEAAMTLWWIGDVVLLLVVLPVVVYLLNGVSPAARSIVPSVRQIADAAAGSQDLDAAPLLLTTQDQVTQTVAGVASYGGSLDVILDDADRSHAALRIPAAGLVPIVAVVLIVLALVYYLVSTILALREITAGLDEVMGSVGEIIEKSAPVNEVVTTINAISTPASTCWRACWSRRPA